MSHNGSASNILAHFMGRMRSTGEILPMRFVLCEPESFIITRSSILILFITGRI